MTFLFQSRLSNLAIIYAGTNVLNAAVPFLLLPVLTRALSPADYGIVAMFGIVVSVLNAFIGLNVHGAVIVRYFQLDARHLRHYLSACLAVMAGSALALLSIVAASGNFLSQLIQIPRAWLLIAVAVSVCQFCITLRLNIWQVRKQAWTYGTFQVLQSILNAGLSLFLVFTFGMSWEGRTLAQTLAVALCAFLAITTFAKGREISRSASWEDMRDAMRFGVPLVPHAVGALLIATVDRLMITNLMGVAAAGIYVVAAQIGLGLGLMTDAFNRAYAPWLHEQLVTHDLERDKVIVRRTYTYFTVVLGIAIIIGLMAPWFLSFLVGPAFRAAAPSVLYIAVGYAFGGMYYMVTNYVFHAGRTGLLACVTISAGLLNILASYLLIRQNGLVGAAQGFMLSQAVLFGGAWWLAQRSRPMPWKLALPPRQ